MSKRQTGRTTKILFEMLQSNCKVNFFLAPRQMYRSAFRIFLDICEKMPNKPLVKGNTIIFRNGKVYYKFMSQESFTTEQLRGVPSHKVFLDHTCFE
jgi:hypothetical protein